MKFTKIYLNKHKTLISITKYGTLAQHFGGITGEDRVNPRDPETDEGPGTPELMKQESFILSSDVATPQITNMIKWRSMSDLVALSPITGREPQGPPAADLIYNYGTQYVTHSSGVFSFSTEGYYHVAFRPSGSTAGSSDSSAYINITTNDSAYSDAVDANFSKSTGAGFNIYMDVIFKKRGKAFHQITPKNKFL